MNNIRSYIFAFIALTLPFLAFFLFITDNDISVKDKSIYYGCYFSNGKLSLKIDGKFLSSQTQQTKLKDIIYLKRGISANVENRLEFDIYKNELKMGAESTGFYYQLKNSKNRISIMLSDGSGGEVELHKQKCKIN